MRDGQPFYFTHECVGPLTPDMISTSHRYQIPRVIFYVTLLKFQEEATRLAKESVTLAQAVAASSAFPILFQPMLISYEETVSTNGEKKKQKSSAVVTDGGVYDNIGTRTRIN